MEKWWWFQPGFGGFFYVREKIQNKKNENNPTDVLYLKIFEELKQ